MCESASIQLHNPAIDIGYDDHLQWGRADSFGRGRRPERGFRQAQSLALCAPAIRIILVILIIGGVWPTRLV